MGSGIMTSIIEPELEPTIRSVIDRVTGGEAGEIQVLDSEDYRPRRISLDQIMANDGREKDADLTMDEAPELEPLVRQLEDLFELYGDSPEESKHQADQRAGPGASSFAVEDGPEDAQEGEDDEEEAEDDTKGTTGPR